MGFSYFTLLVFLIVILYNHSQALTCGTEEPLESRLILNQNGGLRDIWDTEQRQDLSFCLSPRFASRFSRMEEISREAASQWMAAANVELIYRQGDDCGRSSAALFKIVPVSRRARYKAKAFFPSAEAKDRVIQVNRRVLGSSDRELLRIMLHEMGHVLGFRHEHIHPDGVGDCIENTNFEWVAEYDPLSIMHYQRCGPLPQVNYVLSEGDKKTAEETYPF